MTKQAKKVLLLVALLALVLAAALWGYPKLVERYEADRLAATPSPAPSPAAAGADGAPDATAAPEPTPIAAPDFTVYDAGGRRGASLGFCGQAGRAQLLGDVVRPLPCGAARL